MSEVTVLFTLEGVDLTMQMRDTYQKYATKIDKNMDSLVFLYEGNKVNYDLTFKEQAGLSDGNKNEIKIMVMKIEDKTDDNRKVDELKTKVDFVETKESKGKQENLNHQYSLENIKSKYIIVKVFSYIKEKTKLKLINYNKKLQEMNDISLYNSKFFSGSYKFLNQKQKENNLMFIMMN